MTKTQKMAMIFTGSILLLLIVSATILLASSKMIYEDGKLYTLATNYSPQMSDKYGIGSGCEAMMPECGVCQWSTWCNPTWE